MSDFADALTTAADKLGQTFLIAYYLPSVLFATLNTVILVPVWQAMGLKPLLTLPTWLPTVSGVDLNVLVQIAGLSFVLGMVLSGMNERLIGCYSGRFWWLRGFLLYLLARRNRQKVSNAYAELEFLRDGYRMNVFIRDRKEVEKSQKDIEALYQQLQARETPTRITADQRKGLPELQARLNRVAPTAFGNALASVIDYLIDHYRIDAAVFWPRLLILMGQRVPNDVQRLNNAKIRVDMTMNLSFLAFVLAVETLVTLIFSGGQHTSLLVETFVVAGVMALIFYSSSVAAVTHLAQSVIIAFDQYRHWVFEMFGLQKPATLYLERKQWESLEKFIRYGEPFNFPAEPPVSDQMTGEKD